MSKNLRMINGHFKTTSGHFLANCVNIFHKTKIQTCLEPQNDHLNLSFVKNINTIVKKMAKNGRKTAIYQLQIFVEEFLI